MMPSKRYLSGRIVALLALLLTSGFLSNNTYAIDFTCKAEQSWVTAPNPPAEVPLGTEADFCQFYQFSWQWFLKLVSPSAIPTERNFQVSSNYPILEANNDNSCDDIVTSRPFVTSLNKIPDRTGQAGTSGKGIYDKVGNVVFYNIRFSRNMCDVGKIQSQPNFPSGTTEIKTAWKQLTSADDTSRYFVIKEDIDNVPGLETLGLIGFHLAIATDLHPEMIWSSFEQVDNSPRCNDTAASTKSWSFASQACIESPSTCTWNNVDTVTTNTGHTPTQICTEHPFGTANGDPNYAKNITAITDLNTQVKAFLTGSGSNSETTNAMSVWQYYFNIGALWVNDITQPSANAEDVPLISNQRGSLRMANTVMETSFQDGFSATGTYHEYSSNCFGCHEYTVDPYYRNTGPHNGFDVSHIFTNDILAGQCKTPSNVNAGPIWSDKDAQAKCASTCETKGGWNGQWTTTQPGVMSVCECCNAQ